MGDSQKIKPGNAAVIVMLAFTVSRLTGFLREMLIPAKLGVDRVSDAYNIAFLLPDLMYTLVIGGAVSAALVPVLSGYIGRNEEEKGWKAISIFINVVFLLLGIFCILGMIFAPQLIRIVIAGYGKKMPEDIQLTIKLTRILFPSVSILMLAGISNGVLYSYKRFVSAAYGPALYNIFTALSFFLFSNRNAADNYGVEKVAYGVLGGTTIYFLVQAFQARKYLSRYRPKLQLKEPGFVRLFKLAVPSIVSSSVLQVNIIVSASIASVFADGSVTSLRLADRLWQMPLGIIAQGIGFAMLPSLSEKYAIGEHDTYKSTLVRSLKTVLMLAVPCAFGLVTLSHPLVKTIYQFSNKMDNDDVSRVAGILVFYSAALIMQSITTIVNRGFYARNDTKTPLFISTGTIASNILLCILAYKLTHMGVAGMAAAYSVSSTVNAVILIIMLNKKAQVIPLGEFLKFVAKALTAAAMMAVVLFLVNQVLPFSNAGKLAQILYLTLEVMLGIAVYFGMAVLLKVKEASELAEMVFAKVGRMGRKLLK